MDLWEVLKASKGVPITSDMYDALFGKALGGAGSVWETENAPYLFRRSGGSLRSRLLGKEKDTIVGASVGWNQLLPTPVSNSATQAFNNGQQFIQGHKYLFVFNGKIADAKGNIPSLWFYGRKNGSSAISKAISNINAITIYNCSDTVVSDGTTSNTSDNNAWIYINNVSNIVSGTRSINVIDLTLAFGSTIADYIYTLEQGTAGAGVSKLREWGFLTEPYYAYNQGEIKSVSGLSAHKMVGKNLLNIADAEIGTAWNGASNSARARLVIPCFPSTTYTLSMNGTNGISNIYYRTTPTVPATSAGTEITSFPKTITTLSDAKYIVLAFSKTSITQADVEALKLQLEFGSATDYAPYHSDTYALDSSITLRGLFKMDADHNLYADGDTYESSGVVTRKYGVVDLGTLPWTYNSANTYFGTTLSDTKKYGTYYQAINMICPKYEIGTVNSQPQADKQLVIIKDNTTIRVRDTAYTDAPTFKTAMSGVYLVYELATPTTETADAFTNPQSVDKAGTEEYVSTQNFVPIGHETQYKCEPL